MIRKTLLTQLAKIDCVCRRKFIRDSALRASGLLYRCRRRTQRFSAAAKRRGRTHLRMGRGAMERKHGAGAITAAGSTSSSNGRRPIPQLINFDAPDSNVGVSRRRRSNTPLQALNLLNDPVFMEAAQAIAVRVLREAPPAWNARLDYAFQLCFARNPLERERQLLTESFQRLKVMLDKEPDAVRNLTLVDVPGVDRLELAAWVGIGRSLLNTDEFVTRE